jgi:hypothetical protein
VAPKPKRQIRPTLNQKAAKESNVFTRSSRFEKMCRTTFSQFDFDNSGSLDTTEVYAAVLSLYTKILLYVTTARVPSHEEVKRVSDDIDYDKSGHLDFEEFKILVTILSERLGMRVLFEALFLYVFAPAFAMLMVSFIDAYVPCPECIPAAVRTTLGPMRDMILVSLFLTIVAPKFMRLLP